MANDPFIPDDIKRLNNGVRPGVRFNPTGTDLYQDGALNRASQDSWLARPSAPQTDVGPPVDTSVRTITPTPDAVSAGPPRAGVVNGSSVSPPSPLDANQPLPKGVRLYGGTPGTNDVIYEGVGAHGERAFGNNQFNVAGTQSKDLSPGMRTLMGARSKEIDSYLGGQQAAADAGARAYAIAPKTAGEQTDRMRAQAEIGNMPTPAERALKDRVAGNDAVKGDYFTGVADTASKQAASQGASSDAAQAAGERAAAAQAALAGIPTGDPSLPPAARAGDTAIKSQLANLINNGPNTASSLWHNGLGDFDRVDNPNQAQAAEYSVSDPNVFGVRTLSRGKRQVYLPRNTDQSTIDYVSANARGLQRKSS